MPVDSPVRIDVDFPGGNGHIDAGADGVVVIRPDLRDTEGDWFYWAVRVRGAEGRTLRFHVPGSGGLSAAGPGVSPDGFDWRWLGTAKTPGVFEYSFGPRETCVYFSMACLYTRRHLDAFMQARPESGDRLRREPWSEAGEPGQPAEYLRFGRLDGRAEHRVLLAARHHACEMMANYVLEGVIDGALGSSDFIGRGIEALAIPFVDPAGVEAGDQGKNRRPHDHNRDYFDLRYAVPRALATWGAPFLSTRGGFRLALDLHDPYIAGGPDQHAVYLLGSSIPRQWERLTAFSNLLERAATGPVVYTASDNLPFGQSWNVAETGHLRNFMEWAQTDGGAELASVLEYPYALIKDRPALPEDARLFGRDLAAAIADWCLLPPSARA